MLILSLKLALYQGRVRKRHTHNLSILIYCIHVSTALRLNVREEHPTVTMWVRVIFFKEVHPLNAVVSSNNEFLVSQDKQMWFLSCKKSLGTYEYA